MLYGSPKQMNKLSSKQDRKRALKSNVTSSQLIDVNFTCAVGRALTGLSGAGMIFNHQGITRIRVAVADCMTSLDTKPFADAVSAGLPLPPALDPHFEEALRYVLDNPGSLVRPRMAFQVATAYGLESGYANDLALALEYFHTASLLFDDLPCMDDASERRGVLCVHLAFGEAGAVLAALALINRAYALSWRAVSGSSQASQSRVLAYIEQRLGVEGLLNGQSLDLHYSILPHNRATTERIARSKTVSLIRLTLVLPAMLGGAPAREVQLLERIALYWGLGYQMVDDLKDVLQSAVEAGKTVARDLLLDRPNAASAMGVSSAVGRLTRFIHLGDTTLRQLLKPRPEMSFLGKLRSSLEEELVRVTENACEMVSGERP
jgi:geranylgeranyl pyrophosphate synthase